MKKLFTAFALLLAFTAVPLAGLQVAQASAAMTVALLPIINSSAVGDDWIVRHVQSSLDSRLPRSKYRFTDPTLTADLLRDNGYVAGFGQLPDKQTVIKLTRGLKADALIGLKIARVAYQTHDMKLTEPYGKEQVTTIIEAVIYSAADGSYQTYTARKAIDKEVGPFTPYEKEDLITAGLDQCMAEILAKISF
ncbi:MAG: hypothetical protein P4N41_16730 [Negativicutes bacterium]|nr:hypothetical protein [Negativicutes bacterium]